MSIANDDLLIKDGLKQLLSKLLPLTEAAQQGHKGPVKIPIETMLMYVHEASVNTTSEGLILSNYIRKRLENDLKVLIRHEVEKQEGLTPEKMKMVAPAILSKILQSEDFNESISGINGQLSLAAQDPNMTAFFPGKSAALSNNEEKSVAGSGWNSLQEKLSQKLNPYSSTAVKVECLQLFLMSSCGETAVIGSDSWHNGIKVGLGAALVDPNSKDVCQLSLKVHAKLLGSMSSHFATKEAYTSITMALMAFYKDKTRSHNWPTADVLNTKSRKKDMNLVLLNIFKLLANSSKELPRYWMRYPNNHLEAIVKAMLDLLAIQVPSVRVLSPYQMLALVDPKAIWLKSWLHSFKGRSIILKATGDEVTFLKNAADHIKNHSPPCDGMIAKATYAQSLIVVGTSLRFEDGRRSLFPTAYSLEQFMCKIMNLLNNNQRTSRPSSMHRLIFKFLITLAETGGNATNHTFGLRCVIDQLLVPFALVGQSKRKQPLESFRLYCILMALLFKDKTFANNFIDKRPKSITTIVKALSVAVDQKEIKVTEAVRKLVTELDQFPAFKDHPNYPAVC